MYMIIFYFRGESYVDFGLRFGMMFSIFMYCLYKFRYYVEIYFYELCIDI